MGFLAAASRQRSVRVSRVQPIPRYWIVLGAAFLLAAVMITYASHFDNGFHFDDSHAVETNPYIRSLHNIPRFFVDARTFSSYPADQNYRPLVTTSLALDYWMAGGLRPFWFHASRFFWFLVQLAAMFFLYRKVLDVSRPATANGLIALFMIAWYGLHPAMGFPWDAVLHSTRHKALTDFGAAGADAFTIQQIAGHASVTTSQRNVHPVPETIQLAVNRLEQYRRSEAAVKRPGLAVVPKTEEPATESATLQLARAVAVGK